jgi:hypothetical protein
MVLTPATHRYPFLWFFEAFLARSWDGASRFRCELEIDHRNTAVLAVSHVNLAVAGRHGIWRGERDGRLRQQTSGSG